MASTASTIVTSQQKNNSTSSLSRGLVKPKGISAAPFRVLPSRTSFFTIKVVHSEKPTYQVIQPINGVPFIGSLETSITSIPLIIWHLSSLLAYRTIVNPLLREVEVALAHGYLLVRLFVKTGPLKDTSYAGGAGLHAAAGLVVILSICLMIYGIFSFKEGEPSTAPTFNLDC